MSESVKTKSALKLAIEGALHPPLSRHRLLAGRELGSYPADICRHPRCTGTAHYQRPGTTTGPSQLNRVCNERMRNVPAPSFPCTQPLERSCCPHRPARVAPVRPGACPWVCHPDCWSDGRTSLKLRNNSCRPTQTLEWLARSSSLSFQSARPLSCPPSTNPLDGYI